MLSVSFGVMFVVSSTEEEEEVEVNDDVVVAVGEIEFIRVIIVEGITFGL